MKKIGFIIPPTVELLDLAGPVQVFTEAKFYGFQIDLEFYIIKNNPTSTSGLGFGKLAKFSEARLKEGDFVFVPGMDQNYVRSSAFRNEQKFFDWLKKLADRNINVCSVCNGAFALAEAGLLNGLECTTHWRRVDELQAQFPKTKVLPDVLFVKNSSVCTSGGITAGIDLALSILEDLAGAPFAQKVARGLVVYYRANDNRKQEDNYLDSRNHLNFKIHEVQNYLINNISSDTSISKLASGAGMSPRNLTRLFKQTTGVTVNQYLTQLRLETAKTILKDPKNSLANAASKCGFKTARQLQRILKQKSREIIILTSNIQYQLNKNIMEHYLTHFELGNKRMFTACAVVSSLLGILFLAITLMQKPPLPHQVSGHFATNQGGFILFATLSLVWSIISIPTIVALEAIVRNNNNKSLGTSAMLLTSSGILLNGTISFLYVGALISIWSTSGMEGANSDYQMSIWTNLFYFMSDPALMLWGLGQLAFGTLLYI